MVLSREKFNYKGYGMKNAIKILVVVAALTFTACGGGSSSSEQNKTEVNKPDEKIEQNKTESAFKKEEFGIFTVVSPTVIEMGNPNKDEKNTISKKTPKNFAKLIEKYPNIKTLNIRWCDGSMDDDANFIVSQNIHDHGININLMDNGEIYSGGVDLFLAGVERTIGKNTKIGVHAWGGDGDSAEQYPNDHEVHKKYIKYYLDIGYAKTEQESKDFYFFTIKWGPTIHEMTAEEIEKYKMATK